MPLDTTLFVGLSTYTLASFDWGNKFKNYEESTLSRLWLLSMRGNSKDSSSSWSRQGRFHWCKSGKYLGLCKLRMGFNIKCINNCLSSWVCFQDKQCISWNSKRRSCNSGRKHSTLLRIKSSHQRRLSSSLYLNRQCIYYCTACRLFHSSSSQQHMTSKHRRKSTFSKKSCKNSRCSFPNISRPHNLNTW